MSMSSQPRLSVVIPVRNGEHTIADQLDALMSQDASFEWDVVVADNGSTDGTRRVVETHPLHDLVSVRVVDASQMAGVNHARNRGVESSQGEFVVFCDCDDVVHQGWVQAYGDALAANPNAIASGPLVVHTVESDGSRSKTRVIREPKRVGNFQHGLGANFGMHRSVWDACGGFSTDFREGFDEIEFMVRAQKGGAAFVWVEDAVVDYRVHASLKTAMKRIYKHGLMRPLMSRLHPDAVPRISAPRALVRCVKSLLRSIWNTLRGRGWRALEECAYSLGIARGELRLRR